MSVGVPERFAKSTALFTKAEPFQVNACPDVAELIVTSDNALIDAAAIRASALASVKYLFVDPSGTVSVSPCVNHYTS